MLFRKKLGFLVVLAVFFLLFAAGCDSGSNGGTEQAVVTTVETEADFSGALEALSSGETIEISENFGTEASNFQLDKNSGNYSITGSDTDSLKKISGELTIGNGRTIDLELANLKLDGTLTVDIGSGDLDLNNVDAQRLEIKSAGSVNDDSNNDNDTEQEDNNSGLEVELDQGYLNLYLSSENSINTVQTLNNGNSSEKPGKPENPGNSNSKEISEINVVIERIEFKNSDDDVWQEWEAFSEPQAVNLLSENLMEEFKVEGEVEAGEFDSLRLYAAAEYDETVDQDEDENNNEENNEESDQTDENEEVESPEVDDDSTISEAAITEESVIEEETEKEETEEKEEQETDNFTGTSHLVYEDGSKEELWVHAASKAGIKIKGDFRVEAGTTSELNISFDAAELINMRGPKVAPMLLPKAFKMTAKQTKGSLSVEVLNLEEVEVLEMLLRDSEDSEYSPQPVEDQNGLFIFSQLKPGEYQLELKADGYQSIAETVVIEAGQRLEKSFTMEASETENEEESGEENEEDTTEEVDEEDSTEDSTEDTTEDTTAEEAL